MAARVGARQRCRVIAGYLRRYEHFKDRESPPSYSWVTTDEWRHSYPLVLTVSTRPPGWDAEVPATVAQIFEYVWQRIEEGLVLRPGTVMDCGANPPWDSYPRALVCVPVSLIAGVPLAEDTLALVGLHASELVAMTTIGKARVLAHLGHFDESPGFGQTCSWKRGPLTDRFGLDASELTRIQTVRASDWSCVNRRSGLTLRMTDPGDHSMAGQIAALAPEEPVAFLLDPAWEVRAMPPWPTPPVDLDRPAIVGAWSQAGDGTGIQDGASPAFLAFALTEADERVENLEDGLLVWLKQGTATKLGDAMSRRHTFDHDFPDRSVLRVRVVRAKAAPAKVDEQPLPERAAVPGLPPVFAPGNRWHTFTTPFKRVYPGVKK